MPLKLTEEVRGILTSGKPAHLVTLNPDGSQSPMAGLDGYLAITGTARISQGGAPQLLRRLAAVYLGPGAELPWTHEAPPGHVTYITAERIVRPDPPNRYKSAPARLPSGRTIALPLPERGVLMNSFSQLHAATSRTPSPHGPRREDPEGC